MRKITVIGAIMIMLVLAHWTQGGVSLIRNGSFENDGQIPDITVEAPQYWCDVNIPSDKFNGKVSTTWKTKGNYSLFFYVKNVDTYAGDMAMISQWDWLTDVLGDVNKIYFDIKLSDPFGNEWDLEKRTALVLIDDTVVWDSNDLGPSVNGDGEYLDRWIDVGIYDANPHKLTLAIKINEDIPKPGLPYWAQWDFVKFDTHCGGFGYLPEDLNYDCYVDMLDLKMLAEQWLEEKINEKYDLFEDDENFANFRDFVIFASYWQDNTCQQPDWCGGSDFDQSGVVDSVDLMMFAENWLRRVVLLSDLNEDEVVNFYDFALFAEYWTTNSDWENWQDDNCYEVELLAGDIDDSGQVDLRDVSIFTSDWLAPVDCDTRADINDDGVVNFQDFAVLAEEWWLKSWLYGL